jgi:chorismate mutase
MDLSDWRTRIDEADRKLVALLSRRAHCVLEIAKLKKALGLPIYEPQREDEIFRNVASANGGPLDQGALRRVFERIIDECRSIQRRPMGTDGTQQSEVGRQPNPNRPEAKKKRLEEPKKKKAR